MAWTTPETFTAGQTLTAASMNLISGNLTALPRGRIGYAEVTAAQSAIGSSITDLTGLSVTFTAEANRRYLISGFAHFYSSGGSVADFHIRQSTTTLQSAQNPISGGYYSSWTVSCIVSPSAGSVTYKLSANANSSTMVMQAAAGRVAYILVEDIGGTA